jgi:hypothetical protein
MFKPGGHLRHVVGEALEGPFSPPLTGYFFMAVSKDIHKTMSDLHSLPILPMQFFKPQAQMQSTSEK